MRRKPPITTGHDAHLARVAWWTAFLATVALVAIVGLARSAQAQALPAASPVGPLASAPSLDEEEEEAEAEAAISEDEAEELEAEECEAEDAAEQRECEEEGEAEAPRACLLSTAEATVSASNDKIHLLVRYTTTAPIAVGVEYGLHGAKGSLYLGGEKKHVGVKGKLRLTKRLSDPQMEKVLAAKNFTVRLRVPDVPAYCHPFFDRQLDVRRATPAGLAWSQSE
jgi:hypothetical protein